MKASYNHKRFFADGSMPDVPKCAPTGRLDARRNSWDHSTVTPTSPDFELRIARTEAERHAAQRLRYEVFVTELGGDGAMVDHRQRLERDLYDAFNDHLILLDRVRGPTLQDRIVGAYRLLRAEQAAAAGQFYSEDEYDLRPLRRSGRSLLELGRSCVHHDYRGGMAMHHLWLGLGAYVRRYGIEIMFGVASFHGREIAPIAAPLSLLHARHLAPPHLRVRAREDAFQRMDLIPPEKIDRAAAMRQVPALIKGYLRLGGFVGDGAFIDHAFNTVDVCLVMDTALLNERRAAIYDAQVAR